LHLLGVVSALADLLARHPIAALFLFVLAEQSGLPVPATPALLAAGASLSRVPLHFAWAVAVASVAALAGDILWYWLGRWYGRPMLNAVCRVSLEPASCARRATEAFGRRGVRVLLVAKFIPGVSTTAPTLAALFGVSPARFILWDGAGTVLWVATFMGAGALFRDQVAGAIGLARHLGTGAAALAAVALVGYMTAKGLTRRRFLRRLRVDRIAPEDLATLLDAGAPVTVVDLRHALDVERDGAVIPGALRIVPEDLSSRHGELPRDRDIVLYCSCPDEATSASVALRLRAHGLDRIRPLAGGFDAWRAAGRPVASVTPRAAV
jgi:membrane protein DedA with SNARE-associated domain/rhodanese-related sulfurtransferase